MPTRHRRGVEEKRSVRLRPASDLLAADQNLENAQSRQLYAGDKSPAYRTNEFFRNL
jgi:hypothetical protein